MEEKYTSKKTTVPLKAFDSAINHKIRVILDIIKAPTRWHCVTLQVQAFVQS